MPSSCVRARARRHRRLRSHAADLYHRAHGAGRRRDRQNGELSIVVNAGEALTGDESPLEVRLTAVGAQRLIGNPTHDDYRVRDAEVPKLFRLELDGVVLYERCNPGPRQNRITARLRAEGADGIDRHGRVDTRCPVDDAGGAQPSESVPERGVEAWAAFSESASERRRTDATEC